MNDRYAIAIDIGTSGIRAQTLDIGSLKVISTAITLRHPLPGANVVDHLHFALKVGIETAHNLLIEAINKVIAGLNIDTQNIERVAVCGNPIQLSLFNNIEIRDLAYWGENALERLDVKIPSRNSTITSPKEIGLIISDTASIFIPPAIRHEIGADALAMLFKTEVLDKEGIYLVSDFGTNAEIALVIDGEVFACSAAAGPAIEGQMINKGRLASPGAICDLEDIDYNWKSIILDNDLLTSDGDVIDPSNGKISLKSTNDIKATGITGTGVIAAFSLGISNDLIVDSKIKTKDHKIHLQDDIYLNEDDIINIGKALGAFRAAHLTLAEKADILLEDIDAVYMAGASGFYVDPLKSLNIGQIPPSSREIFQVGNTSLDLAKDIALNPSLLDDLQEIADKMRSNHIMLATSKTFEKIYSLELSFYEEGMPFWMYNQWLEKYGFQSIPSKEPNPIVHKIFERDIPELGVNGLNVIKIGLTLEAQFDGCTSCLTCIKNCPEDAISLTGDGKILLRTDKCAGLGCQKCVLGCPEKVFDYGKFLNIS
ncbi:methyltransferase activation protein, large subunit [Methanobrevibacter arboriphilus JCM 13429 = DSM 1125]|uniref:Methyltransferase activation protein, large subunit n=1 Tax=Methanobrevibacter arboriphilus JCM 13429 = DSM 1125 TaxID=1300164 RepID=A0A1V6N2V8_METAZ|nr:methylamine methyltransferase corrinoid protein reductive activase [Methanobrevibacter arboriphilus]OQD58893.1 methyltransferase activation protein, large subunit [Methanobrevibacter arboriphilus JCM 13429 = DSM 1125]